MSLTICNMPLFGPFGNLYWQCFNHADTKIWKKLMMVGKYNRINKHNWLISRGILISNYE